MGRWSVEKALGPLLGRGGGAEVAKELQEPTALRQVLCHTHHKYQLVKPSQQHGEVGTGTRKPQANRGCFTFCLHCALKGKIPSTLPRAFSR